MPSAHGVFITDVEFNGGIMRNWIMGVSLAAALAAASEPAQATTTITYRGTIANGLDGEGLFGTVNGDLHGKSFLISYVYDGSHLATSTNNSTAAYPFNYDGAGTLGPITSFAIKIGGITYSTAVRGNNAQSQIVLSPSIPSQRQVDRVQVSARGVAGIYGISAGSFLDDKGFDTINPNVTFSYARAPFEAATGATSFLFFNTITSGGSHGAASGQTYGTADLRSLSFVTDGISAVPEPGTWGMMMLGFGAIGTTMRRRRLHQMMGFTA